MNLFRSLKFNRPLDESIFKFLERLAEKGCLQNNQMIAAYNWARSSRLVELICSMKHLETLNFMDHEVTPDVLARVFQSCSKLIELRIATFGLKTHKMAEHLKNQLR
jgi:archaellum biogenesis ATPase FlaH